MKLVVPFIGEQQAPDTRLIRLAEFLGIACEPLSLERNGRQHAAYLDKAVPDRDCCFVIAPQVMREWVGRDDLPSELVSFLLSRFSRLMVHRLNENPAVPGMIASLSGGRLVAARPPEDAHQPYEVATDSQDVCGPFAGLSFGPINIANDRVLAAGSNDLALRKLICIGGRPLLASVRHEQTEILFLAGEDVADVNCEVGRAPLTDYFSRLVPHAMALRYMFGKESWQPCKAQAALIIDDPLLWKRYGWLNFEALRSLMESSNFHTTIAFIPHNYRRNSPGIVIMFRENAHRLSICFHGNDHTEAELASTDAGLMNTMLSIAERRMEEHTRKTGLHCDKVMVFPQENFSVEAMEVLKCRNFHAAINSRPHPMGNPVPLTIAELARPAVLRYGGFPLFLRKYLKDVVVQEIAFNVFFGKPVFIVGHHEMFKNTELLSEVVQKVNTIAPGISWSNPDTVVGNAILKRRTPDGTVHVQAYSGTVRVHNDSPSIVRMSLMWPKPGEDPQFEQVLQNGARCAGMEVSNAGIRVSGELAPGATETFSLVYRNAAAPQEGLGLSWDTKAFVRRRLSEVRDNYLSRNQFVLQGAKTVQRRFLK
jgi:hypothetical protein